MIETMCAPHAKYATIVPMQIMCLDLEGVLFPEVWIAVARHFGNDELLVTTREIPDYNELMNHRLRLLQKEGIGLREIEAVLADLEPLEGALSFLAALRASMPVVILSDTFEQFSRAIAPQLDHPVILCNRLEVEDNVITDYVLRQDDGKRVAVESFQRMNLDVFAAGDSYNDLAMIIQADHGALFHAPDSIRQSNPDLASFTEYEEILTWAGVSSAGR
jgi:phosphoserine/homoserine phosphotransferase